jgi:hypothetical protein
MVGETGLIRSVLTLLTLAGDCYAIVQGLSRAVHSQTLVEPNGSHFHQLTTKKAPIGAFLVVGVAGFEPRSALQIIS